MTQILNPRELMQMAADLALAEQKAAAAKRLQADQAEAGLRQAFESRDVAPEAPDRINKVIRDAAEQGKHEAFIIRFPSTFCKDGGRSINNFEPDWPDTLTGFARKAFEYYQKELNPLGYTLRAEIMTFPGGMPGDVGLYLRW